MAQIEAPLTMSHHLIIHFLRLKFFEIGYMFLFFETCFAKGVFYFNVMSWELLLLRIFYAI